MTQDFPPRRDGAIYLTEGGTETEIMFKHGFELPEFSMYPLLNDPRAMDEIRGMFRRYLSVCAMTGAGMVMAGLDYRASPDWARKIGYSLDELGSFIRRNIAFLREMRAEFAGRTSHIYVAGVAGPRGDAYGTGGDITADEAEAYHAFQIAACKEAGADMMTAATFNNIPESVGIIRAAQSAGIPIGVSLTLTSDGRLRSGPTLKEAVEAIDAETGGAAAWLGINCSHPDEFTPALEPGAWSERLRYIRPNAARMEKVALCKLGHLEDGDPVELGQQMAALARRFPKADILGGCCGTDERHLEQIARAATAVREAA